MVEIPTSDVERPSTAVDARVRQVGAAPRLPPRQGAGERGPPALQARRSCRTSPHAPGRDAPSAKRWSSAASSRSTRPTSRTSCSKKASRSPSRPRSTSCRPSIPATSRRSRRAEPPVAVEDEAVDQALERLRERAARFEAGRGRRRRSGPHASSSTSSARAPTRTASAGEADKHETVPIELGAPSNPPGFDDEMLGHDAGRDQDRSRSRYPDDYAIPELAGGTVDYTVTLKEIKKRVVPALDDEFAKDLGEFESLDALRARVRAGSRARGAARGGAAAARTTC